MATNSNIIIGDGFNIRGDGTPDVVMDILLFPLLRKARKNAGLTGIGIKGTPKPADRFKVETELNKLLQTEVEDTDSWVFNGLLEHRSYDYELDGYGSDIFWKASDSPHNFWATRQMYKERNKQLKIR